MPDDVMNANDYIRAITRNEEQVKALTESMRDLKRAVEELIDRVDADIDTLRTKTEAFGVIAANVDDVKRRVTVLETKVETAGLEAAALKTTAVENDRRVTIAETKIEALQYRVWMAGGAIGAVVWIATRIFK